jgi:hypothetical protein
VARKCSRTRVREYVKFPIVRSRQSAELRYQLHDGLKGEFGCFAFTVVVKKQPKLLLLLHGSPSGGLECENLIGIVKPDLIACCYPKNVLAAHPELKGKVLLQDVSTVLVASVDGAGTSVVVKRARNKVVHEIERRGK